jgi:hypothetical protein
MRRLGAANRDISKGSTKVPKAPCVITHAA